MDYPYVRIHIVGGVVVTVDAEQVTDGLSGRWLNITTPEGRPVVINPSQIAAVAGITDEERASAQEHGDEL